MGTLEVIKERLATSDATARIHRRVFRATGGRIGGRVEGRPVLLLATTGRRTGRTREVVVVYCQDGERCLVVPSNAANPDRDPGWWRNLLQDPHAEVFVEGERRRVVGAALPDDERDRLWPRLVVHNPHWQRAQEATGRRFPVVALGRGSRTPGAA